jgi:uncharacterized protein
MTFSLRAAFAALLLAPLGALPAQPTPVSVAEGPTIPLTIARGKSAQRFDVEVADTPASQEQGLMYRRHMAPTQGMIFPMNPPVPASFWMKNTYIPLDLLFIGPDHRIIRIAANAKPLSLALIECPEPVSAVLELNGGAAKRFGLKAGDTVSW